MDNKMDQKFVSIFDGLSDMKYELSNPGDC